ncbi:MAG: hypothetical protein R6W96_01270 [Clostridia bacterium]
MNKFKNRILGQHNSISIFQQFKFFAPLAATSLLIVVTHSLFNAGLARLPSPEVYISAFAVTKSLMHLITSPEMMVRQTVTALVTDRDSYDRVRKFTIYLIAIVVFLLSVTAFSGLSRFIFSRLMGIEGETLEASVTILKVLAVFPIAATWRNFMQGILIKFEKTPYISAATIIRIFFVLGMVMVIPRLTTINPAVLAGLMFLGALLVEALVSVFGAKIAIGNIRKEIEKRKFEKSEGEPARLTDRCILRFYAPLALTGIIHTVAMPIINAGLGRTVSPEIAISAFAVAWGLGMIFLSPAMMFHQVPLNYIGYEDNANNRDVRRFAIVLTVSMTLIMAAIAFTDLGYLLMTRTIGVTQEIGEKAMDVLKIMVFIPVLIISREYFWGILMKRRLTRFLGKGKFIYATVLTISVVLMLFLRLENPAIIGALAILAGDFGELSYLFLVAKANRIILS